MKILIIYDSLYGNTEVIAQVIKHTLEPLGEIQIFHIRNVTTEQLNDLQLLVIGSPTQQFRPTIAMRSFLETISAGKLHGVRVAAFDIRLTLAEIEKSPPLPFFVRVFGFAAGRIARQLVKKGGELAVPAEGFLVEGMKGPLVKGEVERAEAWARKLAVEIDEN